MRKLESLDTGDAVRRIGYKSAAAALPPYQPFSYELLHGLANSKSGDAGAYRQIWLRGQRCAWRNGTVQNCLAELLLKLVVQRHRNPPVERHVDQA